VDLRHNALCYRKQDWCSLYGLWEKYFRRMFIIPSPGLVSSGRDSERLNLDNSTSQPWSDATCPCTTSWSAYFRFVTLFLLKKARQSTRSSVTGARCVRPWLTRDILWTGSFRRGWARCRGDRRLRTWTALSQHPAIFWHFCGNFCSVRGPLQKLPSRSRYEKWTWHVFCTSSKKGSENRSSRFEPKISWISFSRGSGPPLSMFGRKIRRKSAQRHSPKSCTFFYLNLNCFYYWKQ